MNESLILELYKNSPHRDHISDVPARELGVSRNAQCGDEVFLKWEIVDGTVKKASFAASACSVTIASAEYLSRQIEGKALADISLEALKTDMRTAFELTESGPRVACALLPYEALADLLENASRN